MSVKSFEKFYYLLDQREHYAYEVQNEYELKNGDISRFRGNMMCPECMIAELSFTHKTERRHEYLSKLPSSEHKDGCSYINPYAPRKNIIQFIKNMTQQQIKDRLESILNMLIKRNLPDIRKEGYHTPKENPFVIKSRTSSGEYIRNSIPRKSLNTWLGKECGETPYIFYGKVKLKVKCVEKLKDDGKKIKLYFLDIHTNSKSGVWKFKISVYRGALLDTINENTIYDIAILGCLNFDYKYMQIKPLHKDAILYRCSMQSE